MSAGWLASVAGGAGGAGAIAPSLLALTTVEGQFADPGWRCADASGILPAGVDPVGAACVRTFAAAEEAPLGLRAVSSLADLRAASGGGRPKSPPPSGPGSWKLAPRSEPLRRTGAQIASDSARHQVVLFGGYRCQGASCFPEADTWAWNGTSWTERHPPSSPPARFYGSMAFDPVSQEIVLYGGVGCADPDCDAYAALDDTWTWDGTTWTEQHPFLSPPPRYLAAMAGDPAGEKTVLFGGCLESCPAMAADTWTWDGSSWSLQTPVTSPSARAAAGIAYDAARGQIVLFGGSTPDTTVTGQDVGDTWTWDGSTWTQHSPATSPTPREGAGMAYDATRGATILYGGFRADQDLYLDAYRQDTWLWDGTTWTEQASAARPPLTESPGLAYDEATGKTLLFGGTVFSPIDISCGGCGVFVHEKDTWLLDGTGWKQVPPTWPAERTTAGWGGMGYYPKTKSDILTSGYCIDTPSLSCLDTWSWDGSRWTQLDLPRPNAFGTLVYSRKTRQLLGVFGRATFVFNGKDWTLVDLNGPPIGFANAAPDSTGSVIQFGGIGSGSSGRSTYKNDTYRWNGSSWIRLSPTTAPPAREIFQMAYDPVRRQTVVFGGIGCGKPTPTNSCPFAYLNDTWTWDGSTWSGWLPEGSPPNHAFGVLVNDPGTQLSLLFGGVTLDTLGFASSVNDTWSWNGTNWTEEQPATSPGDLLRPYAAELPPASTAVLFGGQQDNPGRVVSDLWTWSAGG